MSIMQGPAQASLAELGRAAKQDGAACSQGSTRAGRSAGRQAAVHSLDGIFGTHSPAPRVAPQARARSFQQALRKEFTRTGHMGLADQIRPDRRSAISFDVRIGVGDQSPQQ